MVNLAEKPEPPVLELRNLTKRYALRRGLFSDRETFAAVDSVSCAINEGSTLGLVGESGCGKTTLARMILRLIAPTSGEILFRGADVLSLKGRALKPFRKRVQIIFQDPVGSLNPRLKVGTIIGEPLIVHGLTDAKTARDRVAELLQQCGLKPDAAARYPHEFSGGQRQRIGIARALALQPELIICDEPTSALDVSVQAQILNLLKDLQRQHKLSYLFISHDLAVVRYMADDVAVMQHGKIVEHGPVEQIVNGPQHPYTQQLLEAVAEPVSVQYIAHGVPMMQYVVKLSNGKQFGPADVTLLCQWARERRIPRDALLVPSDGGEVISVLSVPQLAAVLDPTHPPTVAGALPEAPDSAMSVMVPYRNGTALAAYYLAVFSLIPIVGILLGAAAFVLGIMGLKARSRRPEIHGSVHAWIGIIGGGGLALLWLALIVIVPIVVARTSP